MSTYLYKRDTGVPHDELRWNWIVDLPFGRGKKILGNANKFVDAIIGGWQVSSMGRWKNSWIGLSHRRQLAHRREPVNYYGRDLPIQDCTSGVCRNAYLMWNGYIPAYLINSVDATGKPNGYMGIPSDYKPAVAPLWPYPKRLPQPHRGHRPELRQLRHQLRLAARVGRRPGPLQPQRH